MEQGEHICNTVTDKSNIAKISKTLQCKSAEKSFKKSNLHYNRVITPKRLTSDGAHLRGLAPGQRS